MNKLLKGPGVAYKEFRLCEGIWALFKQGREGQVRQTGQCRQLYKDLKERQLGAAKEVTSRSNMSHTLG